MFQYMKKWSIIYFERSKEYIKNFELTWHDEIDFNHVSYP
jgi:hypothetical protein